MADHGPLTAAISELERLLDGADAGDVAELVSGHGVTPGMLAAAFEARRQFGRLNDVIHAAAIGLALPSILEDGERLVRRPSLAAGNDPGRPFDVETDRRAAEFKLARWDGHDAGRKRSLFKDLVHLALADVGERRREIYVIGSRPTTFLAGTRSTVKWALNRQAERTRRAATERWGEDVLDLPIPEFRAAHAATVAVIDLEQLVPDLFALEAAAVDGV